jgi:hypothetical protein
MKYFTKVSGRLGISKHIKLKKYAFFQTLPIGHKRCMIVSFTALFLILSVKMTNAQITCGSVTDDNITSTPATCPGNGTITAPTLATSTIYQLSGGGIAGEIQQNSPVFGSLSAGSYTLTLLCTGEPVKSFPVTVVDANSPLGMSLTGEMACAGAGTINAVASGGFNNGGAGVNYQYAMWPEADGGANRTDTGLAYSSSSGFGSGALTEGNYFVRVKDNCGNIFTQSIILKPSKPVGKASLGIPEITCIGGSFTYTFPDAKLVDGAGTSINDFSINYYKYRVEQVSAGTCNTTSVISTLIPDTDITSATTLSSTSIPGILPGQSYRVVITSPCGHEEEVSCFVASELMLEVKPSRLCVPIGSSNIRVTINIYPSGAYVLDYPVTVSISGTGITTEVINVANWNQLIAIQRNYPESAFPLTVTATDDCGLTKTVNRVAPEAGSSPSELWGFGYRFSCAENGNVSANVWPEGNWYGLEYNTGTDAEKTKYELVNSVTGIVVATVYGLSTVPNNGIFFPNVPAGASYFVRVTPPSSVSSTCPPQESNVMTIPAWQGMNFTVTPTVEKICNDGLNSVQYHAANNTGGTLTYKLYSGTDATGTLISTLATPANVPSGTYYYEIVRPSSEGDCPSATRSGTIIIDAWQTNPTITRSLALNCQPLGSGPQATGQALLQFSGFGPFVVERSIDGGPFEVVDPAAVSSYSESSLEAGKVYTYRVTDQCGKSVSQQVMIKPLSPRLTTNINEPCNDKDYTLSAIDFGDPLTTYKWEKNGVVLANTREHTITNFQPSNNGVYKLTVSLLNGCIVRETYITLNSANCGDPFATGSLGDKVWYDTNSDSIQDAAEAGVPNVPVTLQGYVGTNPASPSAAELADNANWTDITEKMTDANGEYLFNGLDTGYYRVKFGSVANYGFTTPNAGGDATLDSDAGVGGFSGPVFINAQGVGIDKDNPTIDAGLVPAGSIGDYVWIDDDQNGKQDASELAKGGVTVKLYVKKASNTWDLVESTVSGSDGKYLFSGLLSGIYQVEFVLPVNHVFTYVDKAGVADEQDSDANMATGKTGEITIDPSQPETSVLRNNLTVDAGLVEGGLPVKLSMFDVKKGENVSAVVRWTTTEEVNSEKFEVQRSTDAKSWNAIGQIKAKGNSAGIVNYRFDDMQPNLGSNYYRLKMIDLDGSFAYSSIRKLSGEVGAEVTIYPNPVSNELSVLSTTGQAIGKVEIISQNGKVLMTRNGSTISSPINVKNLPAGIYLVKISFQNGTVENRKVIISR